MLISTATLPISLLLEIIPSPRNISHFHAYKHSIYWIRTTCIPYLWGSLAWPPPFWSGTASQPPLCPSLESTPPTFAETPPNWEWSRCQVRSYQPGGLPHHRWASSLSRHLRFRPLARVSAGIGSCNRSNEAFHQILTVLWFNRPKPGRDNLRRSV